MNTNFIAFPCIEVKQGEYARLYLGSLTFESLRQLYTVSPREPRTDDPYYDDAPSPYPQFSQRPEKKERLREISEFVKTRLSFDGSSRKEIIFPGTIILGLLTDIEAHEEEPQNPTPTAAHLIRNTAPAECFKLFLSKKQASLFVIDGQHRIKGLGALCAKLETEIAAIRNRRLINDLAKTELEALELQLKRVMQFEVPISLLIDFDLEEQAMVFATVNFKQKSVQRSFYYDIFGAFESDRVTPISFSHELAIHLNNSSKSPLKGMIKLLGTGHGLISQAFLVARLKPLLDPQDKKSVFRTFFNHRHDGDLEASRQFAEIVRNFFEAVQNEFSYAWPVKRSDDTYRARDYNFILAKSMVMSGFLALLREIYKLCLLDFAEGKESEVANTAILTSEFFAYFLKDIDTLGRNNGANSIFGKTSQWAIGGSAILERTIFDSLRANVFTSYIKLVNDDQSAYQAACVKFQGRKSAIRLAPQYPPEKQKEFWSRTEAEWEKSLPVAIDTTTSVDSNDPLF